MPSEYGQYLSWYMYARLQFTRHHKYPFCFPLGFGMHLLSALFITVIQWRYDFTIRSVDILSQWIFRSSTIQARRSCFRSNYFPVVRCLCAAYQLFNASIFAVIPLSDSLGRQRLACAGIRRIPFRSRDAFYDSPPQQEWLVCCSELYT